LDRKIVSVLCLFDFFDGSFSVIQPKASLPIFISAAESLNRLTKKSLVKVYVSFSVIQPKALSAYNNIAFEIFDLSNEKISRQK
jgi:hypothetical protein